MTAPFRAQAEHRAIIGLVHLAPLPGTPFGTPGGLAAVRDEARRSAAALVEGGADGCLVQTVDRVYGSADDADPARVAAMALIVEAIRRDVGAAGFAVGLQIMRNAIRPSLAVAAATGADFIRAGALVGATMTPSGLIEGDPLGVAEYRRRVGAEDVAIVADVASMQFSWFGQPREVGRVARDAEVAGANAVAVSDGDPDRALEHVRGVRGACPRLPVVLAGGTDHDNAATLLPEADGAFVGGCFETGAEQRRVDAERVRTYVERVRGLPARADVR